MIIVQRKKELKKEFPNGKIIGKAFVQFYIETKINHKAPNFKTSLTIKEINYLKSTLKIHKNKELFQPYYSLYRLSRQFVRWIENYEHVYYHGLYRFIQRFSCRPNSRL